MKHVCDVCNYTARDKGNLAKHTLSKKHQEKARQIEHTKSVESRVNSVSVANKQSKKYVCLFCDNFYANAGNLAKHKQACSEKQKLIDECSNKQKQYENTIRELQLRLAHKDQVMEKESRHMETLITDNNNLKTLLNCAGGTVEKSLSNMKYLDRNYNKAPPLKMITDVHELDKTFDQDDFVDTIISEAKYGKLTKFIGDIIIQNYKKDNPDQQSFWNSDVDRMTYAIRAVLDDQKVEQDNTQEFEFDGNDSEYEFENESNDMNKNDSTPFWKVDKKGIDIGNRVVKPILVFINTKLCRFIHDNADQRSDGIVMSNMKVFEKITPIMTELNDGILETSILKYIAPYMYIIRRKLALQ